MSSEGAKMLQCYNRSCGQMFDPDKNTSESCLHHVGVPVFHDAYKKWSCCEKKTTDFTEFLNIKGCTKSYHSNVKPPEPQKPVKEKCDEQNNSIPKPLEKREIVIRPDVNQPTVPLSFVIGASLKPMLEKVQKEIVQEVENDNAEIKIGAPCHNKGCRQVYKSELSNSETCLYHSGIPIFHEGMKYWSCCVKRTTDFDSFLDQVGCSTGKHKWVKDKNVDNLTQCRYDWHQTGNFVVISVYSKCPLPELSFVKANPVKLHLHIVFGKEKNIFDEEMVLYGIIDIENCSVNYLGSKVEIKLKKSELVAWKDLKLKHKIENFKNLTLEDKCH